MYRFVAFATANDSMKDLRQFGAYTESIGIGPFLDSLNNKTGFLPARAMGGFGIEIFVRFGNIHLNLQWQFALEPVLGNSRLFPLD